MGWLDGYGKPQRENSSETEGEEVAAAEQPGNVTTCVVAPKQTHPWGQLQSTS
jgi:hypothetical protein